MSECWELGNEVGDPPFATVVLTENPFQPDKRKIYELDRSLTIREWLDENHPQEFIYPTICIIGDEPILREKWSTERIEQGEIVAFVSPPGIPVAFFVALGMSAAWASAIAVVANIAISFGLSQLAQLLIPAPKTPSSRKAAELARASPSYSLGAQGNSARLGSAIPVIYGEQRIYPDFCTAPYNEFDDGKQILFETFCIGQGYYNILESRIEDSLFTSFPHCEIIGIYGPGEPVTAVPKAVFTSVEVSGQEFTESWRGPFIINPVGTTISQIKVDIVAPYGMYYANDEGGLDESHAPVTIQAATVDDDGNLTSGFSTLGTRDIVGTTNSPIRKTYKFTVAPGRYTVRARRTTTKDTRARAGNAVQWFGLRGYQQGAQSYPGVTVVATRLQATNSLSESSSRRVNFKVQRLLPTWNPNTRTWGAAVATRSIAWALADICRASYGAGLADSRYDIDGLWALEQTLNNRNASYDPSGDHCDAIFDNTMTVWEALTHVARLGRAMPVIQGGVIRFVRDQEQSLQVAMFTPRNMIPNTFSIQYLMPSDETADSVTVEYWDTDAMRYREVTAVLPGSVSTKPAKVKLFGATTHAHAWREGMYMAAANRYRRKIISFQTELEGHIPMVGDLIVVSHDMPEWGISGEVVTYDYPVFGLSTAVAFDPNVNHYLILKKRNGTISGPYRVVAVPPYTDPLKVQLDTGIQLENGFTPDVGTDRERTMFAFGKAGRHDSYGEFRVMAPIRYRQNNIVELTAVNEARYVHTADTGDLPPILNPDLLPTRPTRPILTSFSLTQTGTSDAPVLVLNWDAPDGASHYLIEISSDADNWTLVADSISNSIRFPVEPGWWYVRVAAAGLAVGPYLTQRILAGLVQPPGVPQNLRASEDFLGTQARIVWDVSARATSYRIEVWAAGVMRRSAVTSTPYYSYSAEDCTADGGPFRILTFRVWAVSSVGESDGYSEVTLTNPPPLAFLAADVSVYAGMRSLMIRYHRPADLDFAGVRVHASTENGFTPNDGNIVLDADGINPIITIPNLSDGTYYIRMAPYDSFGKTGLDYGSAQWSGTISSSNLPTDAEVLEAVQRSVDGGDALVFNEDAFAIKLRSLAEVYPFTVIDMDGQAVVAMQANVFVMGAISANSLRSGNIESTERITINNGRIVMDGNGAIFCYSTGPNATYPDYCLLDNGTLSFQRYRGGAYYEHKSVKRVETGIASSATTVTLPGYWDAQPKVIVSPFQLQSYDASLDGLDQQLQFKAVNIRQDPASSGIWKFDVWSVLTTMASQGAQTAGLLSLQTNDDDWQSGVVDLLGSLVQVTIHARYKSVKGVGTDSNLFYYRAVNWKVYGRRASDQVYVLIGNKTRNISAGEHGWVISDTQTISFTAGTYDKIYCYFLAYNSGGTYYTGPSGQYDYWTRTTQTNTGYVESTTGFIDGSNGATVHLNLPALGESPPVGYSASYTRYFYQLNIYPKAPSTDQYIHARHLTGLAGYTNGYTNKDHRIDGAGLDSGAIFVQALVGGGFHPCTARIRNGYATTVWSKLQSSDTNAYNDFYFDSYDWVVSGGTTIASGQVNWMAIGD